MKAFEFFAAKDSHHAVALLAEHAANAKVKIIAGGTDLLADLKFSAHGPDVVADISRADDRKPSASSNQSKLGRHLGMAGLAIMPPCSEIERNRHRPAHART